MEDFNIGAIGDHDQKFAKAMEEMYKIALGDQPRSEPEKYKYQEHGFSSLPNLFPTPKTCLRTSFIGRNDKCPCGSGKKYKKCCLEVK